MISKIVRASYLVAACAVTVSTFAVSTVAQASTKRSHPAAFSIRLEDQYLATLRYLPVTFVATLRATTTTTTTTTTTIPPTTTTTLLPTTSTSASTTTTTTTAPPKAPTTPASVKYATKIVPGSFNWRFSNLTALRSQWQVGTNNVVLQGALMRFQYVHNLSTTGQMDGTTWQALTSAIVAHQADPNPYDYVYVSKNLPETVTLYQNGKSIFHTLANTGVSSAPTESGTYPVYLRFTVTTMSGTYPDGSTYSDPGIPWVSYFHGGDALHGFIRSGYGYPQSLGCVEMPFADAAVLWPRTPIGTLVTVQ
jgi:hypothetical protein